MVALLLVAPAISVGSRRWRIQESTVLNSLLVFHTTKNSTNSLKRHMKNLLPNIVSAFAVLGLMAACQTTGSNQTMAQQETLLAQSGFKMITVTTPKQQQAVNGLPQGTVSAVKYQGKLYYVYPTATKDKIYVGKQKQLSAYNQALAAQQTQSSQQTMNPPPTMTYQGHGPHQIVAEEFDGFGPMGTAQLGDW
jgi:long-subunit acyl-CoA synthetase (AMP-forming)